MKPFYLIIILVILTSCSSLNNVQNSEKVTLYGTASDFDNIPIENVTIRLKDKNFNNIYETKTDEKGKYKIEVEKGVYFCLYAIKLEDYAKTKLEYWAWDVPVFQNLEINPKYDKLEIYGINAFEPQLGPFETYKIYFRPMSLTKFKNMDSDYIEKNQNIDIAPKDVSEKNLSIKINGRDSEIVKIEQVQEYTQGKFMNAYLVQVKKPLSEKLTDNSIVTGYDRITIELFSPETNEKGMGEYFYKVKKYKK